mmetsp:Transcript_10975/g.15147  ORF Transcript_10975/g.15147 Transcript_10975/m.15147 type:complete len:140 (+) Transcript_10975:63-482(+)
MSGISEDVLNAFRIFHESNRRVVAKYGINRDNSTDDCSSEKPWNLYVPPEAADEDIVSDPKSKKRKKKQLRRHGARLLTLDQEKILVASVREYRASKRDARLPLAFFTEWRNEHNLDESITANRIQKYWSNYVRSLAPD